MRDQEDGLGALAARAAPGAVGAARRVLALAAEEGLPAPHEVALHPQGGLVRGWRHGRREVRLVVYPDGGAEYLLHGQAPSAFDTARCLLRAVLGPEGGL